MWFGVLGHLAVRRADGTEIEVPGPARRQILAALVSRPGAVVTATTLMEDLWGSAPPRSAANSLRSHIVRLRAALAQGGADGVLVTAGDGYRLAIEAGDVDAGRFEALVDEASSQPDPRGAVACYDAALALWRDEPYIEFGDAPFAVLERIRLAELRALARERRTDLALALGDAADVIGELEQRVRAEPYRERGWEQLGLALYRSGRQADALDAIRRARQVLQDDLGVDPGPGLQRLEQQVLHQDPKLLTVAHPEPSTDANAALIRRCPYLGLAGYDEQDAPLFVGRERLVSALAGRLADHSVVVVTGASGVGKSSLLRAGLVASLRSGALPRSSAWRIEVCTPSDAPLTADGSSPDLLVLDQAEELFTALDSAVRDDLLLRLRRYTDGRGRLVLALRSDFYPRLAEVESLAAFAERAALLVGPMRADELRRALVEPAARAGLRLQDELIETILADVAGQPEPLPLLSAAMVRTWQRRQGELLTLEAYEQAGELAGALEAAAEECYLRLNEDDRLAARRLLVRMTARTASGWVRCPLTDLDDVYRDRTALAALIDARLVVADGARVEIAHDALLVHWPRMREWLDERSLAAELLQHLDHAATQWRTGGRPDSDLYRGARLSAATDWRLAHPEDLSAGEAEFLAASTRAADAELRAARTQTRRLRTMVLALAVVAVLAAAGGLVALHERSGAQHEADRARRSALLADARRLTAESLRAGDVADAAQLALAGYRIDASPATRSALLTAVESSNPLLWRLALTSRATRLRPTPDGSRLLVPVSSTVWVVDTASHRTTGRFRLPPGAALVGVNPSGTEAVVHNRSDILLIDISTGRTVGTITDSARGALAPVMTVDGRWLVVDSTADRHARHVLQVFDLRDTGRSVRVVRTAKAPAAMDAAGHALAVEAADGSVDVRDLASLHVVGSVAPTQVTPTQHRIAVSPDGSQVVRVGPRAATSLTVYDTRRPSAVGTPLPHVPAPGVGFGAMRFSPDGARLAVGTDGGPIRVYAARSGALVNAFAGNAGQLFDVAWGGSAAEPTVYSVGLDAEIDAWRVANGPRLAGETGPDYPGIYVSPESQVSMAGPRYVIAASAPSPTSTLVHRLVVDLGTGSVTRWPDLSVAQGIPGMSATSNGRYALEADVEDAGSYRVAVWDLARDQVVWQTRIPWPAGLSPAFGLNAVISPDGRRAYADLDTTRIAEFAMPSGRDLGTFSVHFAQADRNLIAWPWAVDPAGRLLVWGNDQNHPDGRLGLVDRTGALVAQVRIQDSLQPMAQAWSPDGRQLAVGTASGTLFLLDARTLAIKAQLHEPSPVRSVSFSPDGRTLVATGEAGRVDFYGVPGMNAEAQLTIGTGRVFGWYDGRGDVVGLAGDPHRSGDDYRRLVLTTDRASLIGQACSLAGGGVDRALWRHDVGDQPYRRTCP